MKKLRNLLTNEQIDFIKRHSTIDTKNKHDDVLELMFLALLILLDGSLEQREVHLIAILNALYPDHPHFVYHRSCKSNQGHNRPVAGKDFKELLKNNRLIDTWKTGDGRRMYKANVKSSTKRLENTVTVRASVYIYRDLMYYTPVPI